MGLSIRAIRYCLPEAVLSNEELASTLGRWNSDDIERKTGVAYRHIARGDQCASDLAHDAARLLLDETAVDADEIDFVFLVTQTPDYLLPTTACILQHRLGLSTEVAAFDINLGCSGFVYALAVARAWMASGFGARGLILTADTYTRFLAPDDASTRTLFGDAGAAVLVEWADSDADVGAFVFGTDGSGANALILDGSGCRMPARGPQDQGVIRMDGPSIFAFTLDTVPQAMEACATRFGRPLADFDMFCYHQANAFMISNLAQKSGIPREKAPLRMANRGNTVSSSIPILLADLMSEGAIQEDMTMMLIGFGVGLSWAVCALQTGSPLGREGHSDR